MPTREQLSELLLAQEGVLPPALAATPKQPLPPEMTLPPVAEWPNMFERAMPPAYDPLSRTQQQIGGAAFGLTGMGSIADMIDAYSARDPTGFGIAAASLTPVGKIAGKGAKAAAKIGDLAATPRAETVAGFAPTVPGEVLKPTVEPGLLGRYPTTKPREIYGKTLEEGGYSVHLPTGVRPTEGLMVGKYKNTDPRNVVVSREEFRPSSVKQHVATNVEEFNKPDIHFGSWVSPEDKVYLDVVQRFDPDKLRLATKTGERTKQLAGYNVGTKQEFPIGQWRDFVASPEFRGRMDEMAGVGRDYLSKYPSKEWWDMHGSAFERAYGTENLPQVAGFSAATAPVSNPYDNMRAMSEYMRRHIKGEPTIQPDFRIPEGGMGPWSAGKKIPLEQSRIANLNKAAAGDLEALQRAKVREEAKAMSGDPNAVVLDRHWARITEDPARGIYANTQPGVINTGIPKRGVGDYDFVKGHVSEAARAANRDPRDYSADVWTGIRETIKNTNQLFGTPHKGSAITGESKSYADIFQELIEKKAKHLGISVAKLDERLRRGDADLLSGMLVGSPVIWGAYQQWQSSQQPTMGGLATQNEYRM